MSLHIRQATLQDYHAITKLVGELGYPNGEQIIEDRLSLISQHADHIVFVAEKNNTILGWIHAYKVLTIESGIFVEIGGLVVSESTRGQGIGRNLVMTIRQWAHHNQILQIRARSNIVRTDTHRFYLQLGFQKIKEQMVFCESIINT